MKKMKGFIDPVSLSFIVVLGIGAAGTMASKNTDSNEQLAQESQDRTELITPAQEQPKT